MPFRQKNCNKRKMLPIEHLKGCQGVKMFFLKTLVSLVLLLAPLPPANTQSPRKQWAAHPVPGESSHNRLRWAVRGWMMGEEPL